MNKTLFLTLLLLAYSSIKPMEKLPPEDKSKLRRQINYLQYVVAYIGREPFAGSKSNDRCLRDASKEVEDLLQKNKIALPETKDYNWLEALSKSLSQKSD